MIVTDKRPLIAIPMGDPAGIGPEITAKALAKKEIYDICRPVVVGDVQVFQKAIGIIGANININLISNPTEGTYDFQTVDFIDLDNIQMEEFEYGQVQAQCGKASYEYVNHSVALANKGEVDAIATTPINKESLRAGLVPFIGHTEMLGELTNTDEPLTMFEVRNMRIFFLTRHVSLKEAISQMTKERVHEYLLMCDKALKRLGLNSRKMAVAGLNPHSGENGLFGSEEIDEIEPGIKLAQEDGVNVTGTVPADSVFFQALSGKYDAVLSLYHDQGHIAAKMTDFHRTISITNGLPFLRTSVDHGTAFDIAGKNIAESISMEECIKLAAQYAPKFTNNTMD